MQPQQHGRPLRDLRAEPDGRRLRFAGRDAADGLGHGTGQAHVDHELPRHGGAHADGRRRTVGGPVRVRPSPGLRPVQPGVPRGRRPWRPPRLRCRSLLLRERISPGPVHQGVRHSRRPVRADAGHDRQIRVICRLSRRQLGDLRQVARVRRRSLHARQEREHQSPARARRTDGGEVLGQVHAEARDRLPAER